MTYINMSVFDLKKNGYDTISNIRRDIPVSLAKKYCYYYTKKNRYGTNICYFKKSDVEYIFSNNKDAILELEELKKAKKSNSQLALSEEIFVNCSVTYSDWTTFRAGQHVKESKRFDNVTVKIKGSYAFITIGNTTVKKHILRSNVEVKKYV